MKAHPYTTKEIENLDYLAKYCKALGKLKPLQRERELGRIERTIELAELLPEA